MNIDRGTTRRRKTVGWIGLGFLAVGTLVFAHEGHKAITTKGVSFGPRTGKLFMEPLARRAVGLTTTKVDFATIEDTLRVPARVLLPATGQAFASARLGGVIESIRVKPGDRVKAGDVLAQLSSTELDRLQLELTQSMLERRLLDENLRRARELGERIVAGRDVLELETDLADKDNAIRILTEKLRSIGLSDEQVEALTGRGEPTKLLAIPAPLGGHVVHADLALGSGVEPTKHVVEIHDVSTLWILGEVPESRSSEIRQGQEVRIRFPAYPGRRFTAAVERLSATVSEATRTVSVWASLPNADLALKPGQFGEMSIVTGVSENVTAAPVAAIVEDGAEMYAVALDKERTYVKIDPKAETEEESGQARAGFVETAAFVKKNVVLGRSDGRLVEIVEGLYPGDTIVADAGHELSALYVQGTLKLSDEAKKNIALETEEVDLGRIDEIVSLNAALRLPVDASAAASSRIHGKVVAIRVAPGQEVGKGEALADVHSLELDTLQLDYRAASLREQLLRRLVDQLRAVSEIAPRKELLRLETEHRARLSSAVSLRRRLELLGLTPPQLDALAERGERVPSVPIAAPIAGRVVDVDAVLGQVVTPEDHLFKIADGRVLWAEARVFEGDFEKVVLGAPGKETVLRLAAFPGLDRRGRVTFSAQSMAFHERHLPVYAEIRNEDGALKPGMIGRMAVVVGRPEREVIAAPRRALLSVGGQAYAFVQVGKSFKRVAVEVGRQDAYRAEIVKGLFPGDKVAVSGVNELNTAVMSLK